jgi:hypothetical protein
VCGGICIKILTKTCRVIEKALEMLVDWASAALEKSSNQPVLPHAILLLNASDNSIGPGLWDVEVTSLTESFPLELRSTNCVVRLRPRRYLSLYPRLYSRMYSSKDMQDFGENGDVR